MVALLVLPPGSAAETTAEPLPVASVYVNVVLSVSAATTAAGFNVPAVVGATDRLIDVPPGGAGMSSVTVSVIDAFGATEPVVGVSVTVDGASVAPRTRTCAVRGVPLPSCAVSVTSVACETP